MDSNPRTLIEFRHLLVARKKFIGPGHVKHDSLFKKRLKLIKAYFKNPLPPKKERSQFS